MKTEKNISKATLGLLGVCTLGGVLLFFTQMVGESAFRWTFLQPGYRNALIELAGLAVILFMLFYCIANKLRLLYISVGVTALFFSFFHAFFYAFLAGVAYGGMIWLTGWLLGHFFLKDSWREEFSACFVLGIAGLLVIIGLASLLGVGTSKALRIIFLLLFAAEILVARKKIKKVFELLHYRTSVFTEKERRIQAILLSGIVTMFLFQVGRANLCLDYDTVWYGLRSDAMLAPYTGIYDKVISLGVVYINAKGFEALSLPMSGLTSYGFIFAVNLMLGAALLKIVYDLCRITLPRSLSLTVVMAVAATPAIMNMTITAKPDIATLLCEAAMLVFLIKGLNNPQKTTGWLPLSLGAMFLSFAFKATSLLFATLLGIICVLFALKNKQNIKAGWRALLLPFLALAAIWGRTVYLTGCPNTFLFPSLWSALKLPTKYPYDFSYNSGIASLSSLFDIEFLKSRFLRLFEIFFAPTDPGLTHILITWAGILFAVVWFLALFSIVFFFFGTVKNAKESAAYNAKVWIFLLLSAVSGGSMMMIGNPDGNYFTIFYLVTYWFAATQLMQFMAAPRKIVCLLLTPLLLCNVLYGVVSSGAWAVGMTPIQLSRKGYYNHSEEIYAYMESQQLNEIYSSLSRDNNPRVMLFSSDVQYKVLMPAVLDTVAETVNWGKNVLTSSEEFLRFAQYAGIESLVLDGNYLQQNPWALDLIKELGAKGYLQMEVEQFPNSLVRLQTEASIQNQELDTFLKSISKLIPQ